MYFSSKKKYIMYFIFILFSQQKNPAHSLSPSFILKMY